MRLKFQEQSELKFVSRTIPDAMQSELKFVSRTIPGAMRSGKTSVAK
jgi:hypothetical protein